MKKDDGGYWDTHYLMSLLLLKKNGCYEQRRVDDEIEKVVKRIVEIENNDIYFSDLYAERIVALYWAGKGDLVRASWIDKISNFPGTDSGWADKGKYFSNAHTTGLALLSLLYYQDGSNSQQFYH